ncbi:hypothetical protein SD961_13365 [Erwinia sp. MMLR14_017]|uniref:hypothetical protein n=1 Tax=Erwinia sp. MMLR14_017 TaxID=3093842 RepID=UPI002990402C|nr:hypothetical protein [Erwinia sp. MMLR14_017]MDW8846862.1 hypothetical protein [Erwinia sp. MMLR14_017]
MQLFILLAGKAEGKFKNLASRDFLTAEGIKKANLAIRFNQIQQKLELAFSLF